MTNRNAEFSRRAHRIVDRVMPTIDTPHGFYDPAGFVAACQYGSARTRLYYRTFARLRAKAESGAPYLTVPPSNALVGGTIWTVARELEAERIAA